MPAKIQIDKTVRVDGFEITEASVVDAFKAAEADGQSTEEYLRDIISLGSRVLAMANAGAGVQQLADGIEQTSKAMKDVSAKLTEEITKKVDQVTGEDGDLAKAIQGQIDEFGLQLEKLTGGEDSPIRAGVKKQVDEMAKKLMSDFVIHNAGQRDMIAKLLDVKDPQSPLRILSEKLDSVDTAVKDVQKGLTKEEAITEIVEATPVGGNQYEDVAVHALQMIAGRGGDNCVSTGGVTGRVARSKMGDATVDLKVGGKTFARLVMEAKNSPISILDWEREAAGSKANRAATGFIGMCKYEKDMPNKARIMILDSQSIVVACDPENDDAELFALVYQVVKMNTLSTAGSMDDLNLPEVNKNLADAISALTKFDNITKSVSAIENSAASIKKEAKGIRDNVTEMIEGVQNAIRRSLESEAIEMSLRAEVGALEAGSDA